jgi:hypothetical protein
MMVPSKLHFRIGIGGQPGASRVATRKGKGGETAHLPHHALIAADSPSTGRQSALPRKLQVRPDRRRGKLTTHAAKTLRFFVESCAIRDLTFSTRLAERF